MQKVIRDKSRFLLSAVTHEMRNPLTLIQSYLQLVEGQYPQIRNSSYWEIVKDELCHLNHILNDFSLYQNGIHTSMEPTPMSDWLRAYIRTISPVFNNFAEIDFLQEISDDLPILSIDSDKMRQLLDNLIRNSLEAIEQKRQGMREGAAAQDMDTQNTMLQDTVTKDMQPEKHQSEKEIRQADSVKVSAYMKGSFLHIDVTDTGCGVDLEKSSSVFEPFASGKENGTGLGLPICRRIAQAHGGTVRLSCGCWGKTQFQVSLPAESRI
ncbi:MAG: HAMP domain-containing sensor histidine kinase [Eubacteriales bacterium]|nr:HAMP domain-containing sensor histidine kinase [Eubacteriales bacterium]